MAEAAPSLRSLAVTGVRWNAATQASTAVLQILQTAVLARLLPAADFGLIGLVLVAAAFAQALSDFGLGNAIIYRQASAAELSSIFWANVLGGAAALGIACLAAPAAAAFYGAPSLRGLLPLAGLAFLIAPVGQPLQALMQKELRFRRLFFCETGGALAGAAAAIACALASPGAHAFAWGMIAAALARVAALWAASAWHPSFRLRVSDLRPFLSFGLYQTGERMLNFLVQNVDKLLIGKLLGTEALGFYSVAYQLMIRPMALLNPVITRVAFPVFARLGGDRPRLREGYLEVVRLVAFVMIPLYFGMHAASGPLLRVLLGPGWGPSEELFRALVFLGLLFSLGNPLGSLLLALGRASAGFWFNAFAFAVYSAAIALGSRHGLTGVAWAQAAACLALLVPGDLWLRWKTAGMLPGEYLRAFLPFLAMGAGMAALLSVLRPWLEGYGDAAALAGMAAAGTAVYLAMARLWTRAFLSRALGMVGGKT